MKVVSKFLITLAICSFATSTANSNAFKNISRLDSFSNSKKFNKKSFLVVIDPGHGGNDIGAVYRLGRKSIREKDLTLQLAQDISRALKKLKIQTVLTREIDKGVPLPERTRIANQMRADIFISIHINSHAKKIRPTNGGFETYILNQATNKTSQRLAELENSVLDGSVADSFNNKTDVALIVKDLLLDANIDASKHLACLVQKGIVQSSSRFLSRKDRRKKNRGVKQALFYILLGADMPSILLEAGFINNYNDRKMIHSQKSRRLVSAAIAKAIDQFRTQSERTRGKTTRSCRIIQ